MIRTLSPPPHPPIAVDDNGVRFPDARRADAHGLVAIGADFSPATLLTAYRAGIFPWPHGRSRVPWVSPDPRANFELAPTPHWSRSLRRTLRRHNFALTVDAAFAEVMAACADTRPEGTWITRELFAGYVRLHRMGWAHSVEVWSVPGRAQVRADGDDPWNVREDELHEATLVGGIYGVSIGALFAGESMFHRVTDASKIAFASLVERLRAGAFRVFDVQVMTEHLESLGCVEVRRAAYLERVREAVDRPAQLVAPSRG